jgi:hypothetical protein
MGSTEIGDTLKKNSNLNGYASKEIPFVSTFYGAVHLRKNKQLVDH